jgi:hypothetical protein
MPYDFSRFDPFTFQNFVQALALHVFGADLQVYGAGPDGARDATFEGTPNYPSPENRWQGYTVIQVKYRQKLTHDSKDADWLVNQIKREQAKLARSKTFRVPDYYLIVTNVDLSPMPTISTRRGTRKGGMEKVDAALQDLQKRLKLKACHVWNAEKLSRLVETAPTALKHNYAFWITPNELLWRMLQDVEGPDFTKIISRAAAQDMREHKFTRLQEAGHTAEENTLLSQVFVDLPVRQIYENTPYPWIRSESDASEPEGVSSQSSCVVSSIVERSRRAYGNKYVGSTESELMTSEAAGRIVLLGGPGQGKSTIGQYLVQLFQAQLLTAPKAPGLSKEAIAHAKEVIRSAKESLIPINASHRFPVRIILPAFADRIASLKKADGEARFTVLDYVAEKIARLSNEDVSLANIRKWLCDYPWLIVLDGLDEVPASGERPAVLREIEAFFDEIADLEADALVIVTTRPQGYNEDLDPKLWSHWELTPLGPDDALKYARKLAEIRLAEPSRRRRVLERLATATRTPATNQLLVSPLQVAILFTLVDVKGDVPTDRWNLFERYFNVLRDREEAKGGINGELLRLHRSTVELVHQRAGFLLHVEAERSGGAQSFLTESQFEEIVQTFLSEAGHAEDRLAKLTKELGKLATDRLVLLSAKVQKRIAFDVRSLQEYMAAAMITSAADTLVEKRLRIICGTAHWRHTFQIAASRCFSDTGKRHLADSIIQICAELDAGTEDGADRLAKSGAFLATDLLADGLATEMPRLRKLLFDRALGSLDLGHEKFDKRLSAVVDDILSGNCADYIRMKLRIFDARRAAATWPLLLSLVTRNLKWAIELAKELWPADPAQAITVVNLIEDDFPLGSPLGGLTALIQRSVLEAGLELCQSLRAAHRIYGKVFGEQFEQAFLYRGRLTSHVSISPLETSSPWGIRFIGIKTAKEYAEFGSRRIDPQKWAPFVAAARFTKSPSKLTLAEAITLVASSHLPFSALYKSCNQLPWPLAGCIAASLNKEALSILSAKAANGDLGDTVDWQQAEARWATAGVEITDLENWNKINLFYDKSVATVGTPGAELIRINPTRSKHPAFKFFLRLFLSASNPRIKSRLVRVVIGDFAEGNWEFYRELDEPLKYYASVNSMGALNHTVSYLVPSPSLAAISLDVLDHVGRAAKVSDIVIQGRLRQHRVMPISALTYLVSAYAANTNRRGLLPIIFSVLQNIDARSEVLATILHSDLEAKDDDTAGVKFSAAAISVLFSKTADEFIKSFVDLVDRSGAAEAFLIMEEIVRKRQLDTIVVRSAILTALERHAGDDVGEQLVPLLRASLDTRHTQLEVKECWCELGFPASLHSALVNLSKAQSSAL